MLAGIFLVPAGKAAGAGARNTGAAPRSVLPDTRDDKHRRAGALPFDIVNGCRAITFDVTIGGRRADSETTCAWMGPETLAFLTMLGEAEPAVEAHLIFAGRQGMPTYTIHVALGPAGHEPTILSAPNEQGTLDPTTNARECLDDHAAFVLKTLTGLGHDAEIDIGDDALQDLARVEH